MEVLSLPQFRGSPTRHVIRERGSRRCRQGAAVASTTGNERGVLDSWLSDRARDTSQFCGSCRRGAPREERCAL